jgi:hypothetical protein
MLKELLENIESIDSTNLNLYFVSRKEKANLKNKKKILEKYDYTAYKVEIDAEIRKYLYGLSKDQIKYAIDRDIELIEYDVILDDTDQILTYQMKNKAYSFMSVVNDQLPYKSTIRTIQNLSEIIEIEELWAYCVAFTYLNEDDKEEELYTFRKITSGKIVVDENENIKSKFSKQIRTIFSTKSNKLEMLHGETINLDKQIDCIYKIDTFYILKKKQFESLVGLEEDYKEQAKSTTEELAATGKFSGIEKIADEIENNTAIHRKLIKIKRLSNYSNINKTMIANMKKAGKKEKYNLKVDSNGCIMIEDKKDVDMVIKLLCDYYKEGVVTGKSYGTYSGKIINE